MDHGDGRNERFLLQILIETPQLMDKEHALVDDRSRRQRTDVGVVIGLLEDTAHHVEFAVEVDPLLTVGGFFDETLFDAGHLVDRLLAEGLGAGRDRTPSEEVEPLFCRDDLHHFLCLRPAQLVLRQEQHADAVFPRAAQSDTALSGFCLEKVVRRRDDDADAVTGLPGRVFAGAVLQLLDDLQRAVDDAAGRDAFDRHDRADPAGIVLELFSIEQVVLQSFIFHS